MKELRCICTYATEEEWLSVKIVVWFSVTVVTCWLVYFVILFIKDWLEMRRRAIHRHGREQRNAFEEERFEEIRE